MITSRNLWSIPLKPTLKRKFFRILSAHIRFVLFYSLHFDLLSFQLMALSLLFGGVKAHVYSIEKVIYLLL